MLITLLQTIKMWNWKGEPYVPNLVTVSDPCGLHHSHSLNITVPRFLDKSNPTFKPFHAILDNLFKMLMKEGTGSDSKHVERDKLWKLENNAIFIFLTHT